MPYSPGSCTAPSSVHSRESGNPGPRTRPSAESPLPRERTEFLARTSRRVPNTLSAHALTLAQLDHEPEGFLAISVGDRFQRRIAAQRGVGVAVDLGELAP